jgi:hypothetical protein
MEEPLDTYISKPRIGKRPSFCVLLDFGHRRIGAISLCILFWYPPGILLLLGLRISWWLWVAGSRVFLGQSLGPTTMYHTPHQPGLPRPVISSRFRLDILVWLLTSALLRDSQLLADCCCWVAGTFMG